MEKQKTCLPTRRGSGLIFAVVLLFVILGMVITLSSITVLETKMSQKTKSSIGSFYNSEAGVEWALNKIATASGSKITDAFSDFSGGKIDCTFSSNTCGVYLLDDQGKVISSAINPDGSVRLLSDVKAVRSVGSQGGETQRAIEAAVAANTGLGSWRTPVNTQVVNNQPYQVTTDGFLVLWGVSAFFIVYTDNNNPPTTIIAQAEGNTGNAARPGITIPVRKNDYWKVSITGGSVYYNWIPLGS